jgi:hypothetical protein
LEVIAVGGGFFDGAVGGTFVHGEVDAHFVRLRLYTDIFGVEYLREDLSRI